MSKKHTPSRDNSVGREERLRDNQHKSCNCAGCFNKRYRFSQYCSTHFHRYNAYGDPNQRNPRDLQYLKLYRDRVAHFLKSSVNNLGRVYKIDASSFRRATLEEAEVILKAIEKMKLLLANPRLLSTVDVSQIANYPIKDHRQTFFKFNPKFEEAINMGFFGREETLLGAIVGTVLFCRDYEELLHSGDPLMVEVAKAFMVLGRGTERVSGTRLDKINLGVRLTTLFKDLIALLTKNLDQYYIYNYHTEEEMEKKAYFNSLEKLSKTNKAITRAMLNEAHQTLFNKPYKPKKEAKNND